jgi:multisubunit Na+/H+ antiporter MnhC subunit
MNLPCNPAVYSHIISALFLIFGLFLLLTNYKKLFNLTVVELGLVLLLISIAISHHGQGHILLNKEYGYDPLL